MQIQAINSSNLPLTTVTIIFYNDDSLELQHEVQQCSQNIEGRVIIPQSFKAGKSIVSVCKGEIVILNKVGDRILSIDVEDE